MAVVALLPGLLGPSLDAGVFSVVGDRLAAGHLPYLDVFDHKPPLLYAAIAIGHLLSPSSAWNVAWVLSVASVVLTGVLVADTLRQLGWRRRSWVVGGLAVAELASFPLALGGGLTETAAVLPAAAALRVAAIGADSSWRRVAAGALAGIAACFSLQAAPVLPAVVVAALFRQRPAALRKHLVAACWIIAGAGSVTAALLVLLESAGATAAAVNALVHYNGAFVGTASADDPVSLEAVHALLVISPLAVLAIAGTLPSMRLCAVRPAVLGSITWIALSIGFIVVQGRLELHYVGLMVVPLALLAPAALRMPTGGRLRVFAAGLTLAMLSVTVPLAGLLIATETAMALDARAEAAGRSEAVATWIDDNTAADATVFVWGNAPDIYLRADRAPASEYVYLLPLTTPGYVTPGLIEAVRQGWVANPPAVLVDAGSTTPGAAGLPPLLVSRPVSAGDGRTTDLLSSLREFARLHYRLGALIDGWPVYVLR